MGGRKERWQALPIGSFPVAPAGSMAGATPGRELCRGLVLLALHATANLDFLADVDNSLQLDGDRLPCVTAVASKSTSATSVPKTR
jgi:hypothetical protein